MSTEHSSDHDLLIALNTRMEMMYNEQRQTNTQIMTLVEGLTAVRIEQSRHDTELKNLRDELADLQKKSSFADNINMVVTAVAAVIASAIGYFFGPK
jgi:hypothetical protein